MPGYALVPNLGSVSSGPSVLFVLGRLVMLRDMTAHLAVSAPYPHLHVVFPCNDYA